MTKPCQCLCKQKSADTWKRQNSEAYYTQRALQWSRGHPPCLADTDNIKNAHNLPKLTSLTPGQRGLYNINQTQRVLGNSGPPWTHICPCPATGALGTMMCYSLRESQFGGLIANKTGWKWLDSKNNVVIEKQLRNFFFLFSQITVDFLLKFTLQQNLNLHFLFICKIGIYCLFKGSGRKCFAGGKNEREIILCKICFYSLSLIGNPIPMWRNKSQAKSCLYCHLHQDW